MGATTLAVQATYSLANTAPRNRKVCLIDLDLQGGNAGLYLDIDSSVSVLDCLEDPERMDASLLQSVVTKHRSEEHTSELQSLMCISSADFCLKKTNTNTL